MSCHYFDVHYNTRIIVLIAYISFIYNIHTQKINLSNVLLFGLIVRPCTQKTLQYLIHLLIFTL